MTIIEEFLETNDGKKLRTRHTPAKRSPSAAPATTGVEPPPNLITAAKRADSVRAAVETARAAHAVEAPPVPTLIRVARRSAVVITATIAVTSFVLSFSGLRNLAEQAGISPVLAWLWPLTVDGTIIQATVAVIALAAYPGQRANLRFFWAVLIASAAVSVGGNMLHAAISGPLPTALSALIAMIAPLSLLATTHGLAALVRFNPANESR